MAGKIVIIFDFDRTLIEDDSDRWVLTKMGLTQLFRDLRPTLPWNYLTDRLLEELHIQGKSVDDIAECLKEMPLHPSVVSVIKYAHDLGCDFKVASDSNQFYIRTILEHNEIYSCFSEIISNPAVVDNGRLRIFPYHGAAAPHGCDLCPSNLCKTRRAEFHNLGLLGTFSKIAKTEGVLGFYRGNGASVARIVPYAAYEEYRRWIILAFPESGRGPVLDLIAGSFAGGTAVLFTYPLDLVRTKLAYQVVESSSDIVKKHVQRDIYSGIRDCFFKIYKEAGIRGLYRGVAPSLYGIFPYAGLKFYFYEEMKRHVPENHSQIRVWLRCRLTGTNFHIPS